MTDMVERVARAIAPAAFANGYSSKTVQGAEQARARVLARAAIEAMREPTMAMCEAEPVNAYTNDGEEADHFRPSRGIWIGMIDAALSQSGE